MDRSKPLSRAASFVVCTMSAACAGTGPGPGTGSGSGSNPLPPSNFLLTYNKEANDSCNICEFEDIVVQFTGTRGLADGAGDTFKVEGKTNAIALLPWKVTANTPSLNPGSWTLDAIYNNLPAVECKNIGLKPGPIVGVTFHIDKSKNFAGCTVSP